LIIHFTNFLNDLEAKVDFFPSIYERVFRKIKASPHPSQNFRCEIWHGERESPPGACPFCKQEIFGWVEWLSVTQPTKYKGDPIPSLPVFQKLQPFP
jgi:hypothetical protein